MKIQERSPSDDPSEREWYVNIEGRTIGPYAGLRMQSLVERHQVLGSDLVAPVGASRWVRADQDPAIAKFFLKETPKGKFRTSVVIVTIGFVAAAVTLVSIFAASYFSAPDGGSQPASFDVDCSLKSTGEGICTFENNGERPSTKCVVVQTYKLRNSEEVAGFIVSEARVCSGVVAARDVVQRSYSVTTDPNCWRASRTLKCFGTIEDFTRRN